MTVSSLHGLFLRSVQSTSLNRQHENWLNTKSKYIRWFARPAKSIPLLFYDLDEVEVLRC